MCRIGARSPIRLNEALKLPRCLNFYAPHIARDFEPRAVTAAAISLGQIERMIVELEGLGQHP